MAEPLGEIGLAKSFGDDRPGLGKLSCTKLPRLAPISSLRFLTIAVWGIGMPSGCLEQRRHGEPVGQGPNHGGLGGGPHVPPIVAIALQRPGYGEDDGGPQQRAMLPPPSFGGGRGTTGVVIQAGRLIGSPAGFISHGIVVRGIGCRLLRRTHRLTGCRISSQMTAACAGIGV